MRYFMSGPHSTELITSKQRYKFGDLRHVYFLPYIRFTDYESPAAACVYVNHVAPCLASELIKRYYEFDPRVQTIVDFVQKWGHCRGIVDPTKGYLSSYALTLMVIFFLQIQADPVLWSIQEYDATNPSSEGKTKDIPAFFDLLKRRPEEKEEKRFLPENVMTNTVNLGFREVSLEAMRQHLGFPKNHQTVGELLTLFFYYFGFEYPVGICMRY